MRLKKKAAEIVIESKKLSKMIKRCLFALAKDDTQWVLSGVFCGLVHGKLTIVSTDGRRLATTQSKVITYKGKKDASVILGKESLENLT